MGVGVPLKEINPLMPVNPSIPITLPASKSHANRALIIAALADGTTRLERYTNCDDTDAMKKALVAIGIPIREEQDKKESLCLIIEGGFSRFQFPNGARIDIANAGTAMRFLVTLLGIAVSRDWVKGRCILTGSSRMQERPIQDLLNALLPLGIHIESVNQNKCPPVEIMKSETGNINPHNGARVLGGKTRLRGNASSQYLSSILLCAPYFDRDTEVEIIGELTSKPYVDMTIQVMLEFGVEVENQEYRRFRIRAREKYRAHKFLIEPDASSASYFLAGAALFGHTVLFPGLCQTSLQGDARFVEVLARMQNDCRINWKNSGLEFYGGTKLHGIEADLNDMPDMAPTVAALAMFAQGRTKITNIANLRIKESDRIGALADEIKKFGVKVYERSSSLEIVGNPTLRSPVNTDSFIVRTYDDHRMAMAFAVAKLCFPAILLENSNCVSKSFPGFWREWGKMTDRINF